ncbi:MAG: dockerin type I domain-containing protein [Nanoarchaeota archaeon]|mgnify:CR=1 FL=1
MKRFLLSFFLLAIILIISTLSIKSPIDNKLTSYTSIETTDTTSITIPATLENVLQVSCPTGRQIGDVNGDGSITSYDANLTLQIVAGQISPPSDICCVDVDKNGDISSFDASQILQIQAGNLPSPGVCSQTQTTCNDECILNTRICSGNGYQICGNYDSDPCTEYSTITPCTQNQICSNGICSGSGITLDKCSDGTNYNQCSTLQPRYCDNGVLINNCALCGCPNNGECLADGSCRAIVEGIQSTNQSLINNPPRTSFIPEASLTKGQTNVNNLIDLYNYVSDPEAQPITFTFANNQPKFNSDIIDCYLSGSIINCDPPKKPGSVNINIVASDGNKSSQSEFKINVIPSLVRGEEVKQQLNIAPIADAGSDKTAFLGSSIVLDGSKSYDLDNNLPNSPDNYIWLENDRELGRGIKLKIILSIGTHIITLKVIDSYGLVSTDELIINVKSKTNCLNTKTLYSPPDTICNSKWPSTEGELIKINSIDYSCNLVEVCNENLDNIIEDSINCCDGTPLIEPRKSGSCSFANKYSQGNIKRCQGLYLTKSLGADSIYMQGYFEAEMCCRGVTELCNSYTDLYSARPIPNTKTTNILANNLRCPNTPNDNPPGKWLSDTKITENNIALSDVPAHVSLDILSTGTCVDYSFSLTTLLRKAGYLQNEVYTVEAPNHAYNLVKLPLDKKYTIVDTTGNNEPSILLGKTPLFYEYCENINRCYNDNGEVICPSLKSIYGCENVKESLIKETKVAGYKAERIISNIVNLFKEEIER